MIAQPEPAAVDGKTTPELEGRANSAGLSAAETTTARERSGEDSKAASIEFVSVEVQTPWRLKGRAASLEPCRWGHLAGMIENEEPFVYAIANRFDAEAFRRREGYGWIGFDIDLAPHWSHVSGRTIRFVCMKSGGLLFEYDAPILDGAPPVPPRRRIELRTFTLEGRSAKEEVQPQRLRLYIEAFVARNGGEEFIRRAYRYALERDVDGPGLTGYLETLASGTPATKVIQDLLESEERRERNRLPLSRPGDADFPFYPD